MSWADRASQEANEADNRQHVQNEISLRHQRIKDAGAQALIKQLVGYLDSEVKKYNESRGKKEIEIIYNESHYRGTGFHGEQIDVTRLDSKRAPLKLMYFLDSHILNWKCGKGEGNFLLKVDENNQLYFEDAYHRHFTIQDIGEFVLSKWEGSQF